MFQARRKTSLLPMLLFIAAGPAVLARSVHAHPLPVLIARDGVEGASAAADKGTDEADSLVFSSGPVSVLRKPGARAADFDGLYAVRVPFSMGPRELAPFGVIDHFEKNRFALMHVDGERALEGLSATLHRAGMGCGSLVRLTGETVARRLADTPEPVIPVERKDPRVARLAARVDAGRIRAVVDEMTRFPNRFHDARTGARVPDRLAAMYRSLAKARPDVEIDLMSHEDTPQKSLRVRIRGRSRPDEVVVLGSHIDSVNWQADEQTAAVAPGADDNASGTATNMEVFRALMESGATFERTVEIHGYAAEEVGLVGSQDVARKYRANGTDVVSVVQFDMDLYKAPGAEDKIWFIQTFTLDAFNDALGRLVDSYARVPWAKRPLSGGSSDHESWTRQGFAAAFPFENPRAYNPRIHTPNDTVATSGAFSQAAAFGRLAAAYVAHYGGMRD